MIVASTVFLVAALVSFVVGLFQDGWSMFAVSMGASVLAGLTLFLGVRQGRRAAPAGVGMSATLGPPIEQIASTSSFDRPLSDEEVEDAVDPLASYTQEPQTEEIDYEEESSVLGDDTEVAPVVDSAYLAERARKARTSRAKTTASKPAARKPSSRAGATKSTAAKTARPKAAGTKAAPKAAGARAAAAKTPSRSSSASKTTDAAKKPAAKKPAASKTPAANTTTTAAKPAAMMPAPRKKTT